MPLTAKQAAVLDYLKSFTRANGYQPSYREMAKHFGMSGPTGIVSHLRAIEKQGFIRLAGESRAIRIKGGLK